MLPIDEPAEYPEHPLNPLTDLLTLWTDRVEETCFAYGVEATWCWQWDEQGTIITSGFNEGRVGRLKIMLAVRSPQVKTPDGQLGWVTATTWFIDWQDVCGPPSVPAMGKAVLDRLNRIIASGKII